MPSDNINPEDFFRCTQCGSCCIGYGGTYVTETDIQAIAGYLNIPMADIRRNYCTPSGNRMVLSQRSDGYCVFWDRNCTIHPVKPRMCRRWPFIPSLLVDPNNWRIMAANCPGIQTEVDSEALLAYVRSYLDSAGRSFY